MVDYGVFVFAIFLAFAIWLWRAVSTARLARIGAVEREARAGAVLRAILVASFIQWQVNDINTFFQAFPILLMVAVLFARGAGRPSRA
jgi:hypothetical protein